MTGRPPTIASSIPDDLEPALIERIKQAPTEDVARRIWQHDESLWGGPGVPEIGNRLGWLTISEKMLEHAPELNEFVDAGQGRGLHRRRAARHGRLEPRPGGDPPLLRPDPGRPAPARARLDRPGRRVSRSSARSTSTRRCSSSRRSPAGRSRRSRTCATSTSAAAATATASWRSPTRAARWSTWPASAASAHVFENDPDIGGRYSVLSYFGLVPAALAGVNIEAMLHGAQVAEQNCAQFGARVVQLGAVARASRSASWRCRAATRRRSWCRSRSRASASGSSS